MDHGPEAHLEGLWQTVQKVTASVSGSQAQGRGFVLVLLVHVMCVSDCLNVRNWLLGIELRCPNKP